ncbi:MAG: YihY/virulence factor BrkB family protein [Clostridia bacterium]|nr:YihY/virulence factor BrkB family protein [Clostridia bacterium]
MKIWNFINKFLKKLGEDHIGEYAAQCAYYTFLSFIPFIILLLSLIKYVNIEKDTLAGILEAILPSIMKNSVLDIIQEMYSKSIEVISISAIFMLWSASKSFVALNKGLTAVYNKEGDNYIFIVIKGVLWAIFALILIILILLLLVFGSSIEETLKQSFPQLTPIIALIITARSAISIAFMFFVFLFMYKFSPRRKEKNFIHYTMGAIFTSGAIYAISFFFSIYVNIFTNFSIIYGSLATLIIILMWLNAIIYAILLGAEINSIAEDWIDGVIFKIKQRRGKVISASKI